MSRRVICNQFVYSGHTKGPFISNKFGRNFTHLNKFLKSPFPPGLRGRIKNSASMKPKRAFTPVLSSIYPTPRSHSRAESNVMFSRANTSISILQENKINESKLRAGLKSPFNVR